jgi:hypothetical protein
VGRPGRQRAARRKRVLERRIAGLSGCRMPGAQTDRRFSAPTDQEARAIGEFLDAAKEETIAALRAEIGRLQTAQRAQHTADTALESLQALAPFLSSRMDAGRQTDTCSCAPVPAPPPPFSWSTYGREVCEASSVRQPAFARTVGSMEVSVCLLMPGQDRLHQRQRRIRAAGSTPGVVAQPAGLLPQPARLAGGDAGRRRRRLRGCVLASLK